MTALEDYKHVIDYLAKRDPYADNIAARLEAILLSFKYNYDLLSPREKRWFEKMKKLDENYKKQIHELEHRLSNCIVKPKFNVKDIIFVIVNNNIEEYFVDEILLRNRGTLWAYYDICKDYIKKIVANP